MVGSGFVREKKHSRRGMPRLARDRRRAGKSFARMSVDSVSSPRIARATNFNPIELHTESVRSRIVLKFDFGHKGPKFDTAGTRDLFFRRFRRRDRPQSYSNRPWEATLQQYDAKSDTPFPPQILNMIRKKICGNAMRRAGTA